MFEAFRTTTAWGILAAGIPALLSAQSVGPGTQPAAQQAQKAPESAPPAAQSEAGSPHPIQLDAQHRPITAGGFVKSGPVIFMDDSEKAGLTHWTNTTGTPEKRYLVETKGSGVALIDYDNDGWLDIYVVNGSTFDALDGKATPPHAALYHNNRDGTFSDVSKQAGVTNDRWGFGAAVAD